MRSDRQPLCNEPGCLADANGDGILSPPTSALGRRLQRQRPECDQNSDGSCTPADFSAGFANYNAGC